jgi:hypothetical protein
MPPNLKAALNANCRFVERSNVTCYCYLGILHPLLSSHKIHSCHFSGTNLSGPNTLPGRNLVSFPAQPLAVCPQTGSRETDSLLTSYCSFRGISCDVTINKNIRLNKPMSFVGFRVISGKLIVLCAHFRRQFD